MKLWGPKNVCKNPPDWADVRGFIHNEKPKEERVEQSRTLNIKQFNYCCNEWNHQVKCLENTTYTEAQGKKTKHFKPQQSPYSAPCCVDAGIYSLFQNKTRRLAR